MLLRRMVILAFCCISLSATSQAPAQDVLDQDSDILRSIGMLDHDDPEARLEAANELLSRTGPETEAEIINAINAGHLSLEQSRTLRTILYERFVSTPRGAIGINMDLDAPGIVISRTHEGFPVHEEGLIQPGDEILAINSINIAPVDEVKGQPVRHMDRSNNEMLRTIIFSYLPGDSVELTILRMEEDEHGIPRESVRVIPITLGSISQFNTASNWRLSMRSAFRYRMQRLHLASEAKEVVEITMTAGGPVAERLLEERQQSDSQQPSGQANANRLLGIHSFIVRGDLRRPGGHSDRDPAEILRSLRLLEEELRDLDAKILNAETEQQLRHTLLGDRDELRQSLAELENELEALN